MADTPPKTFTIDDSPRKRGTVREAAPKVTVTATAADVKKAMATLESGYNMLSLGLTIFGFTETATAWAEAASNLNASNEEALKASPKLAKQIASAGSVGGNATFLLTHVMAFAGVFTTLRTEIADRRADTELQKSPVPDFPPAQ